MVKIKGTAESTEVETVDADKTVIFKGELNSDKTGNSESDRPIADSGKKIKNTRKIQFRILVQFQKPLSVLL